jgi:hypothetical protein
VRDGAEAGEVVEGAASRDGVELVGVAAADDLGAPAACLVHDAAPGSASCHGVLVGDQEQPARRCQWLAAIDARGQCVDGDRRDASAFELARGSSRGRRADDLVPGAAVGGGEHAEGGGLPGAGGRLDHVDPVARGADLADHRGLLVARRQWRLADGRRDLVRP